MSYRVWIEMMDLNSAEIKQATKEIGAREGQSPFNKSVETTQFHLHSPEEKAGEKMATIEQHLALKEDPQQQD
jgi:hypothetical protein